LRAEAEHGALTSWLDERNFVPGKLFLVEELLSEVFPSIFLEDGLRSSFFFEVDGSSEMTL